MSRGFKDIRKEPQGKTNREREATYNYLLKTEKIPDKRNDDAKKRFKSKPFYCEKGNK